MAEPRKADEVPWSVQFGTESPAKADGGRHQNGTLVGWTAGTRVDTSEVQKRLAWLLLAAEIGMALVAACVLPLVFVDLPVREEGIFEAIGAKVGGWMGLSSQMACVALVLPIPILLVTLGANLWWFRRMRRRARQTGDQESFEPQG
jgi:hypothetical protein